MEYNTESILVQYAVEYNNPEHPFAESPTKMRFFATVHEMEHFMSTMSPEENVLRAFRQETRITREYLIGKE